MNVKQGLEKDYENYCEVNSKDDYSRAVVDVGELVAIELDDGKSVSEAFEKMAGHGLTGFMATMVVKAVGHFHARGGELVLEWNKRHGIPEAKGLVNPAVMTLNDDGTMTPDIEKV